MNPPPDAPGPAGGAARAPAGAPPPEPPPARFGVTLAPRMRGWRGYLVALGIVALCTLVSEAMQRRFDLANLTMVYLAGVVLTAFVCGRRPAMLAALLSVAAFDVLFVPPRFTFGVSDTQYLVMFAVMLLVAIVVGTLTASLREQLEQARHRERMTAALYRLSHDLAARAHSLGVARAAVQRTAEVLDARVVLSVPLPDGGLETLAGDDALLDGRPGERARARQAVDQGMLASASSPAAGAVLHLPLRGVVDTLGVLSVLPSDPAATGDPERLHLLRAFASQAALALERCRLAEQAHAARLHAESEAARNALLSSISHDLRTPLAAITGAATSLRDDDGRLPSATRRELAASISDEARRLNGLIGSVLDMTRIEAGPLNVHPEWHSLEEVVGAALARLEETLGDRPVLLDLPAELPLVPLDDVLFAQVISNLVENAHKYSPPGAPVEIAARVEDGVLRMDVADRGPGLSPGEESRVFEKFYRGARGAGQPGLGLGLPICRAIVAAHGGTLVATNRGGGGARFTARLPLGSEPPRARETTLAEPGAAP